MVELHADLVLLGEELSHGRVVAMLGCEALEHVVAAPAAGAVEHIARLPAPRGQELVAREDGRQGVKRTRDGAGLGCLTVFLHLNRSFSAGKDNSFLKMVACFDEIVKNVLLHPRSDEPYFDYNQ